MDQDLIKLVNKLQDTFSNLGQALTQFQISVPDVFHSFAGGELDMPQLVVVYVSSYIWVEL